jgi:hypothetical protein
MANDSTTNRSRAGRRRRPTAVQILSLPDIFGGDDVPVTWSPSDGWVTAARQEHDAAAAAYLRALSDPAAAPADIENLWREMRATAAHLRRMQAGG